jgi:hypothetical protein
MSTLQHVARPVPQPAADRGWSRFAAEISVLAEALLNPGKIIREVEQFRALHLQADALDASDPAAAAALRRRASTLLS